MVRGLSLKRNHLILGCSLAIFASALILFAFAVLANKRRVCFKGNCVRVELARTQKERSRGLMNRASMGADEGMLFVFPREDRWAFWMKDTLIPLDIIWLDQDMKIVDIVESAQPTRQLQPPSFRPVAPARYVLEMNAGSARRLMLSPGDQARFEGFTR